MKTSVGRGDERLGNQECQTVESEAAQQAVAPAKTATSVHVSRTVVSRRFAGEQRTLDVRSTSRGRASSEVGRVDPFGRSDDRTVCGALMNGLAGPVVGRRRMPLDSSCNGNREIEEMDVTDVDPQRPRLRGVLGRRGRCGSTSVTPSVGSGGCRRRRRGDSSTPDRTGDVHGLPQPRARVIRGQGGRTNLVGKTGLVRWTDFDV